MAIENYKFVTFTGLFLPLIRFGLDIYEKAVYISAMGIAFLSFYFLSYRLLGRLSGAYIPWTIKHLASFLSALIYVVNPAAANIFFDFSLFVGYAFAPLILILFMEMLEREHGWQYSVIGIAGLWWLSAIKAHWIVFGFILLLPPLCSWIIANWQHHHFKAIKIKLVAVILIIAFYLAFSAYWLFPYIYASGEKFVGSYAPMTLEAVSFLSFAPLLDTIRLLGNFQAWPYVHYQAPNPFLSIPWTLSSFVIPALALAGLIWNRRHWQVWALSAFSIGGIFLVKGFAPPLGEFYELIVFGGLVPSSFRWLLRVSSKWNVFLSLGYSGLISLALAELMIRVKNMQWRPLKVNRKSTAVLAALTMTLIAIPLFCWPSFTGNFNNALTPVPLPQVVTEANNWLASQQDGYKVNWMPITNGRELTWNPRPSGALYTSLSALPSIHTNWNQHPMLYYSFAYSTLSLGQTENFGKLL